MKKTSAQTIALSLFLSLNFTTVLFAQEPLININTAGSEELQTLSGIGPVKAQAIIDYRNTNGPFQKIEDIKDVSGIGEVTFSNIKEFITVGDLSPPSPVTIISSAITSDTTWSPDGGVYMIDSNFSVASGTVLTIEPGTIVKAETTALGGPSIYGTLIVKGTAESPVYFTSHLDDLIGGDSDGNGVSLGEAGQWQGLYFKEGSVGELDHIVLRYAGDGGFGFGNFVGIENDGGTLSIKNSYIHDNYKLLSGLKSGHGVWQKSGTLTVENSVLSNQVFGLTMWGGMADVSSSEFTANTDYGVHASLGGSLKLVDNNFIDNEKTAFVAAEVSFSHTGNASADTVNRGFEITGEIRDSVVWQTSDLPIIIPAAGFVSVSAGSTLTINPGSIVKFGSAGQILVDGNLTAEGTKSSSIYFTSLKDDSVAGDTNGDGTASIPAMTDWDGVTFQDNSTGELIHTVIRYSGGFNGIDRSAVFNLGGNVLLNNITFSNNFQNDVYQNTGSSTVSHSKFSTSTQYALFNTDTSTMDARSNWWGIGTGPTHSTNATGTGPSVSDNILFDPWLKRDPALPNPVIIVPGIMGSYLNKEDGTEVWMDLLQMVLPGDKYLNVLMLSEDGAQTVLTLKATDIVRSVNIPLFKRDTFLSLIDILEDSSYLEDESLFVSPYDWRLDIGISASELNEKINQVKSQTGAEKVNLIAHSMGGLLVKKYLNDYGGESIGKFIDVGTPHTGAPKSFITSMYGNTDISILNKEIIRFVSQNMPSIYQLLPSKDYFDELDPSYRYYVFDGVNNAKRLSFEETKNYLKSAGRNSLLIDRADEFHQEIDSLSPADYGVETYNFVGCGTPTLGQIYIWGEGKYNIRMIDGDGTVPIKSAEAMQAASTYYVKDAKHALMSSTSGVKDLITEILLGKTDPDISPYSNLAIDSSDCGVPDGNIVSFHSPIELHIYDESGNHTGPNEDGDIENNIDGVVYEVIEDNKFAFLPGGSEYTVKGNATGSGTFDVHIQEIVNGEVSTTTLFSDIELNLNTQTNFDIGSNIPSQIYLDHDNDGSFESSQPVSTTTLGLLESLPSLGAETSDSVSATQVSVSNPVISRPATEIAIESNVETDAELQAAYADIYRQLVGISIILDEMAAQEQEEIILPESSSTNLDLEITRQNSMIKSSNLAIAYQAVSRAITSFLEKVSKTIWPWITNRL